MPVETVPPRRIALPRARSSTGSAAWTDQKHKYFSVMSWLLDMKTDNRESFLKTLYFHYLLPNVVL